MYIALLKEKCVLCLQTVICSAWKIVIWNLVDCKSQILYPKLNSMWAEVEKLKSHEKQNVGIDTPDLGTFIKHPITGESGALSHPDNVPGI